MAHVIMKIYMKSAYIVSFTLGITDSLNSSGYILHRML